MGPFYRPNPLLVILDSNSPHSPCPGGVIPCRNRRRAKLRRCSPRPSFTVHGKVRELRPFFASPGSYDRFSRRIGIDATWAGCVSSIDICQVHLLLHLGQCVSCVHLLLRLGHSTDFDEKHCCMWATISWTRKWIYICQVLSNFPEKTLHARITVHLLFVLIKFFAIIKFVRRS
jgi:hypothetical protein